MIIKKEKVFLNIQMEICIKQVKFRYDGEYKNDKKNGQFTIQYSNNEQYLINFQLVLKVTLLMIKKKELAIIYPLIIQCK